MNQILFQKYGSNLKSTGIEVIVNNIASTRYFLPDASILRNKVIVGVQAYPPSELFYNTDPGYTPSTPISQRTLVGPEVFYSSFLTIVCGNDDLYEDLPLISMIPTQGNIFNLVPFVLKELNPSKSYISVPTVGATRVLDTAWYLQFFYLNGPQNGY